MISNSNFSSQEKAKTAFGWAYQKDSQLVGIFNYYTQKIRETGLLNRLRQEIVRNYHKKKDTTRVQEADVLGFENLVFPFLTLFIGIVFAFAQLAMEMIFSCKKSCKNETNFLQRDDKSRKIIEEISNLIQEHATQPKHENLLAQIRSLVMYDITTNNKMY